MVSLWNARYGLWHYVSFQCWSLFCPEFLGHEPTVCSIILCSHLLKSQAASFTNIVHGSQITTRDKFIWIDELLNTKQSTFDYYLSFRGINCLCVLICCWTPYKQTNKQTFVSYPSTNSVLHHLDSLFALLVLVYKIIHKANISYIWYSPVW